MSEAPPPARNFLHLLTQSGAWRYVQALLAPIVIWAALAFWLSRYNTEAGYDLAAIQEWLEEARNPSATLQGLAEQYAEAAAGSARARREEARHANSPQAKKDELNYLRIEADKRADHKRADIYQHLRALGEPATKTYPGMLPLFPVIYRLEVQFDEDDWTDEGPEKKKLGRPVIWSSGQKPGEGRYRRETFRLGAVGSVVIDFQLHAWNKRQRDELWRGRMLLVLLILGGAASTLGLAWVIAVHERERERDRERLLDQAKLDRAERELLAQRLQTEEAQRQALELQSHLYASIGIMAGSYAHNIKNLLVRPNDLLRRCLEREADGEVGQMLKETQQTLALVTDRLQQILQTVRRDPSRPERRRLDLGEVLREVARTWGELAGDRWQVSLSVELPEAPLWVEADQSHLMQAVENLLFNARDATFEMRGRLREEARQAPPESRRQALINAAGWRGKVLLRASLGEAGPVLEVSDNGVGMTEEVRRRCTEAHFSTKRDNALHEGHSAGMGLGLSFVVAILKTHDAKLEIESEPMRGATFRVLFKGAKDE